MTDLHSDEFVLTVLRDPLTLTVRVSGELDYDTSDDLLRAVVEQLTEPCAFRDVRLDFRDLGYIDSTGLSALLMIHRRTSAAGALLHLDHRPEFLERMLTMTNVLDHLTAGGHREEAVEAEQDDGATEAGVP
ncbi:STAS domain-containing protein [Streptomyces galbus]|uniref:STAS domain-containing protein n=1 Tax=Streptomyces galbus TaxID=33898 RepID=A0A4U5X240_STRGB|nr:STAS domain-containing protein [Streptomyces galbus]TKT08071.1 STAS domain-containing protein [Streptomyces galbus]GHD42583.1 sulfate transporter [Streptomyces galbus]